MKFWVPLSALACTRVQFLVRYLAITRMFISFDMLQFKVVQYGKFLQHVTEMCSAIEKFLSNKFNGTWSTAKISLYQHRLLVRVVYNYILEYRAKGLGDRLGYQ